MPPLRDQEDKEEEDEEYENETETETDTDVPELSNEQHDENGNELEDDFNYREQQYRVACAFALATM